jgi:hypothetical protein
MFANQLIGKNAIRTKPCKLRDADDSASSVLFPGIVATRKATMDYSYSCSPIYILAATENHIVFGYVDAEKEIFGDKKLILDSRWCDDGWTDYDELMKLA